MLTPPVVDALMRELHVWWPREACGFLLGHAGRACRVAPVVNALASTGGFAIPDHELRRVRTLAGRDELVAVYHSHPSRRTEPSQDDRAALRHAKLPWLIVTVDKLVGYAPPSAAPMAVSVEAAAGRRES